MNSCSCDESSCCEPGALPSEECIHCRRSWRRMGLHLSTWNSLKAVCDMIKIRHTVFALPFAYSAAFLAMRGWPGFWKLLALTLAILFVRSFAMTINRIADLPFDRKNPRTQHWPLVTGAVSPQFARRFAFATAALFILSCAALNMTCLLLAPLALLLALAYSYTKCLTPLCHFVLGAVLALAPIAGWLSVSPSFALEPLLLAFAVLFWVAGFDIMYSCQDEGFDRREGLHSIPVRLGIPGALSLAGLCHVITVVLLLLAGLAAGLAFGWYFALIGIAGLFLLQHLLVGPDSLYNIRPAFVLNGPVSLILFMGAYMGLYL